MYVSTDLQVRSSVRRGVGHAAYSAISSRVFSMAQKKEKWTNKLDDGHLCHSEQSSQTLSFTQTIYEQTSVRSIDKMSLSIALLVALKSPLRSSWNCQLNIYREEWRQDSMATAGWRR